MSLHIVLLNFDSVVDTRSEQILRARAYLEFVRRQKKNFSDNGDAESALALFIKKFGVGEVFDYQISSSEEVLFERHLKESLYLIRRQSELLPLAIVCLDCTLNSNVFNSFADSLVEIGAKFQDLKVKINGIIPNTIDDHLSAIDNNLFMQPGIESLCDLCSIYPQILPLFKNPDSKKDRSSRSVARPIICSYRSIDQIKSILHYHLQLGSAELNESQLFCGTIEERLEILIKEEQVSQISVLVDDMTELNKLQRMFNDAPQVQVYFASWGKGIASTDEIENYFCDIANHDQEFPTDGTFITSVANLL